LSEIQEILVKEMGELRERIAKLELKVEGLEARQMSADVDDKLLKIEAKVQELERAVAELRDKVAKIASYLQDLYRYVSQR